MRSRLLATRERRLRPGRGLAPGPANPAERAARATAFGVDAEPSSAASVRDAPAEPPSRSSGQEQVARRRWCPLRRRGVDPPRAGNARSTLARVGRDAILCPAARSGPWAVDERSAARRGPGRVPRKRDPEVGERRRCPAATPLGRRWRSHAGAGGGSVHDDGPSPMARWPSWRPRRTAMARGRGDEDGIDVRRRGRWRPPRAPPPSCRDGASGRPGA